MSTVAGDCYLVVRGASVQPLERQQRYGLQSDGALVSVAGRTLAADEAGLTWHYDTGWKITVPGGEAVVLDDGQQIPFGSVAMWLRSGPPGVDPACLRQSPFDTIGIDEPRLSGTVTVEMACNLLWFFLDRKAVGVLRFGDGDERAVWFRDGVISAVRCEHRVGWDALLALRPEGRVVWRWYEDDLLVRGEPIPFAGFELHRRLQDAYRNNETAGPVTARMHKPGTVSVFSGRRIGDIQLGERIGSGGSAQVYRAYDHRRKHPVAVKIMLPHGAMNQDETRRRFLREAQVAADLRHPNLVPVEELGTTEDGLLFLVMELVDGRTLADLLDDHFKIEAKTALGYAAGLAAGLATIHSHGLLHRDVKPENVLITAEEQARLCDFGLVKCVEGAVQTQLTASGTMLGTAPYMAPEYIEGSGPITSAVDVYGLGILLYEMLSGSPPFMTGDTADILWAHVRSQPAPINEMVAGLPAGTAALVAGCLHKDPLQRPTAEVMATRCHEILAGRRVESDAYRRFQRTTVIRPLQAARRRWPGIVLVLAIIVFLITVGLVLSGW